MTGAKNSYALPLVLQISPKWFYRMPRNILRRVSQKTVEGKKRQPPAAFTELVLNHYQYTFIRRGAIITATNVLG